MTTEKIGKLLDRFNVWWVAKTIKIQDYKVATLFLEVLAVACVLDSDNPLFSASHQILQFSWWGFWAVTFAVCAYFVYRINNKRYEVPTVILFFILPLTVFYSLLLGLNIASGRARTFTDILIIFAVLLPIIFVTKTAATRSYYEYAVALEAKNKIQATVIEKQATQIESMRKEIENPSKVGE